MNGDWEFDLGPVLASGQTLRHEFTLTNPSNTAIRLLKAESHTPCCSVVGPIPDSIAPGAMAKIPVSLRPGFQSGRKRVEFAIQTDSRNQPLVILGVQARLFSAWQVERIGDDGTSVPINRTGSQVFRVTCRRRGVEGRELPDSVAGIAPLSARWLSGASAAVDPDDVIETTRTVVVSIPAMTDTGAQRGEIAFRWVEGITERHTIDWNLTPRLSAIPSGLVLKPSSEAITKTVLITSVDQPFRIEGVTGDALAEPCALPAKYALSHSLPIRINTRTAVPAHATDIHITTDHPDQHEVLVSVIVLPAEEGDSP